MKNKNQIHFFLSRKMKILLSLYGALVVGIVLFSYLPSLVISQMINKEEFGVFIKIAIFFIAILISRSTLVFCNSVLGEKIKTKVENDFKNQLIENFTKQNYSILEKTNTETLAFSTSVNIKNYAESKIALIEGIIFSATGLTYTFVFIALQSWVLFLFAFLSISIWVVVANFFSPKIKEKNKIMRKQEEEYAIKFSKLFKNITVTKLLNQQHFIENHINEIKADYLKTKNQYTWLKSSSNSLWMLMSGITQLGIIVLAFWLTRKSQENSIGYFNPANFASMVYISGMLMAPIFRISNLMHEINLNISSLKTINEKMKDWIKNPPKRKYIKLEKIEIKNLSMKKIDDKDKYLFQNINQTIFKGDFVKIEAPSGGGKTTFISLIFNQENNYKGQIIFNDKHINNHDVNFEIGLIKQNSSIFPLSIKENITLDLQVKETEIDDVLNKVGLFYLKHRLNEKINLNATNLSGGEMRRLEIARLLLFKPEVLILDEAFVGIDIEEKNNIIQIIKEQFKNSIVIYTSHEDHIKFNNKTIYLNNEIQKIRHNKKQVS